MRQLQIDVSKIMNLRVLRDYIRSLKNSFSAQNAELVRITQLSKIVMSISNPKPSSVDLTASDAFGGNLMAKLLRWQLLSRRRIEGTQAATNRFMK